MGEEGVGGTGFAPGDARLGQGLRGALRGQSAHVLQAQRRGRDCCGALAQRAQAARLVDLRACATPLERRWEDAHTSKCRIMDRLTRFFILIHL